MIDFFLCHSLLLVLSLSYYLCVAMYRLSVMPNTLHHFWRGRLRFLQGFLSMVLLWVSVALPLEAQLRVEGVRSHKAVEDKFGRVEVHLLASLDNARLILSAPPGSQLWSYVSSAETAVLLSSSPSDGVFVVDKPENATGYFVKSGNGDLQAYWIVDYSSYPLPAAIRVAQEQPDPCSLVVIEWEGDIRQIRYHTPAGMEKGLERKLRFVYPDWVWEEKSRSYTDKQSVYDVDAVGSRAELPASLVDAAYSLEGDNFAAALGVTLQPLYTEHYLTKRLDLHPYIDVIRSSQPDKEEKPDLDKLLADASAPLHVQMDVFANEPSASLYSWFIYPQGKTKEEAVVRYLGKSFDYTFEQAGEYMIALEVSNRDHSCSDHGFSRAVKIRESMLEVPNAFSPGASAGINDIFRVQHRSLVSFKAQIYDRNGLLLYSWQDPDGGWDGKYNGRLVSPGVYFYVISAKGADGHEYSERGHINIIGYDGAESQSTQ
ncbi:gliding motility-associated C-terminal domain [Porphyromonas crevioricanis]|uniref:Gliding motility-associated C-terminal domain n=2 Tax=Porphyromonas crevioricanis TaxID=393921 RepID=A0A2X4PIR5_9PORP|nr:hypothetical protein PORCAN_2136 [Porphyromonas crevioricanis JCM 13913]SQH72570.1 gliding motility-associated C-terminal domain [Porphyromonas crevioricanis]